MFKNVYKIKINNPAKAFTLMELIIVVIIIGILAGIALPIYNKAVEKSRITEAVNMLRAIRDAEERYALEFGDYTNGSGAYGGMMPPELGLNFNGTGRFFYIVSMAFGANPYDNTDDLIAAAVRNNVSAGAYFDDPAQGGSCMYNYWIGINESGKLSSPTCEAVDAFLQ